MQQLTIKIPFTKNLIIMQTQGTAIALNDLKLILERGFFGFYGSMTIHRDSNSKIKQIEHRVVDYRE